MKRIAKDFQPGQHVKAKGDFPDRIPMYGVVVSGQDFTDYWRGAPTSSGSVPVRWTARKGERREITQILANLLTPTSRVEIRGNELVLIEEEECN